MYVVCMYDTTYVLQIQKCPPYIVVPLQRRLAGQPTKGYKYLARGLRFWYVFQLGSEDGVHVRIKCTEYRK